MACVNITLRQGIGYLCCQNGTFLWDKAGMSSFVPMKLDGCPQLSVDDSSNENAFLVVTLVITILLCIIFPTVGGYLFIRWQRMRKSTTDSDASSVELESMGSIEDIFTEMGCSPELDIVTEL